MKRRVQSFWQHQYDIGDVVDQMANVVWSRPGVENDENEEYCLIPVCRQYFFRFCISRRNAMAYLVHRLWPAAKRRREKN